MTTPMKWWGWGDPSHSMDLNADAAAMLEDELGSPEARPRRAGIEEVRLPEPELSKKNLAALAEAIGEDALSQSRSDRIVHSAGKGYVDLVRLRSGDATRAPDAVAYPGSREEVAQVLTVCRDHGIAIVPFGGGTSVVGGVEPLANSHAGVVTLDLDRMASMRELDKQSLVATFEPGVIGPHLEGMLERHGLTLGHYPQSFEYSSVGGWAATRSAGQASTGYGKIESMIVGLDCACPAGDVAIKAIPASAAGPALREVLVGSEGVLGVITGVDLKVRPRPERRRYEGWMFQSFTEGAEAFRTLAQEGSAPAVSRLSDREETRVSMAMAGSGGFARKVGATYIKARGYSGGCMAIFGFEGSRERVRSSHRHVHHVLRKHGGMPLGRTPGSAWLKNRFEAPYLRDTLMDRGYLVETLETAGEWSNLRGLYRQVKSAITAALSNRGTPGLVMCHISHLYRNGASLYFTFLARQETEREIEQWRAVKRAATDAIVEAAGTITHHHAVGTDHAPWMRREVGAAGIEMLRSLKSHLDPTGILNPGKLIPDS